MNNSSFQDKTKILFISPIGQMHGGGERSGFEFCRFLIKQGYDVETVLPHLENDGYIQELNKYGMVYYTAPYQFNGIAGSLSLDLSVVDACFSVVDIIQKVKPDVVISNISGFSYGAVAASIANIPHIWMERGNGYRISDPEIRGMLDFVFKYSNAVIVNSSGLKSIYSEYYKNEVAVVRSFTEKPKVGLNEKIKETRIIAVSRLSPEKNIIELLKAVKILTNRHPEIQTKTIIMGHNEGSKDELLKYIDKNNLKNRIQFIDFDPEPWLRFGPNDIYVNTSFYESVGRSSIEALRLKLPVVLANIPGHSDILELVGGYKYTSGDPDDLAKVLYYVINNKKIVTKDVIKCHKLVQELFSEYNCNREAIPLINSVIGKRNPVSSSDTYRTIINNAKRQLTEKEKRINSLEGLITEMSNPGIKRSVKYLRRAINKRVRSVD